MNDGLTFTGTGGTAPGLFDGPGPGPCDTGLSVTTVWTVALLSEGVLSAGVTFTVFVTVIVSPVVPETVPGPMVSVS